MLFGDSLGSNACYPRCQIPFMHVLGHEGCGRKRNTGERQTAVCGPREPEGFLAVWLLAARRLSKREHQGFKPRSGDIREWLDAHGG